MQTMKWPAAVAGFVLSVALAAGPARADVIFDFVQTSPTTIGAEQAVVPVGFGGRLVVSDQQYAEGFNIGATNTEPPFVFGPADFAAMPDFSLTLSGPGGVEILDNPALFPGSLGTLVRTSYRFTLQPSGTLSGFLDLIGGGNQVRFDVADGAFTAVFGSDDRFDGIGACISGPCQTSGRVAVGQAALVPVPEPASLAVFGLGLAALGAARRRRRAA